MRMTPRVIVKKLIRRWSISSSARCCDRHAFLMISLFTTMSQKNVSDNGSDWCSDTTRRRVLWLFCDVGVMTLKGLSKGLSKGNFVGTLCKSFLSIEPVKTGQNSAIIHHFRREIKTLLLITHCLHLQYHTN